MQDPGSSAAGGLSDEEALLAFGEEHYRSVVATPEGSDHGNIRALIKHGLAGVKFSAQPDPPLIPLSTQHPCGAGLLAKAVCQSPKYCLTPPSRSKPAPLVMRWFRNLGHNLAGIFCLRS